MLLPIIDATGAAQARSSTTCRFSGAVGLPLADYDWRADSA
jgi:hypothetical protein